jgi:2-polyprenyl-6-methoxyphenol hydroxylase-like FAD-dependent oxidoreductase
MILQSLRRTPSHPAASTGDAGVVPDEARRGEGSSDRELDVAIVGGGLSGSLAAILLGRAGYRVAVLDLRAVYPPDFRCEKLAGEQVDLARQFGLFEELIAISTPIQHMHIARFGRLVERKESAEYGFLYHDAVNAVRANIPRNVGFITARVAEVTAGPERQQITLANGDRIGARLVILASGLGETLRHKLGIERRVIHRGFSLTVGFNMAPAAGSAFDFPALTYYGERLSERMAYISMFPIGDAMRANLFCYRGYDGDWARGFRDRPRECLFAAFPGLRRFVGEFDLVGKISMRIVDLYATENHRRDGVVLVGDAFQTTCPAAGNGVTRVLTDVGRLCTVHVPRWLATPGMGAAKIAQFYDDPVKQACDLRSARAAHYCRAVSTDRGPVWQARRWRAFLRPQVRGWVARAGGAIAGSRRLRSSGNQPEGAGTGSAAMSGRSLQPEDSF